MVNTIISSDKTKSPKTAETNATKPATAPTIRPEKRQDVRPDLPKKSKPTIEEKIHKLEELNTLSQRRDLVKEALKNIGGFYIAPTNANCNVKLTDSNGKSFNIAHPFVIEEMLTVVTFKLEEELDKIETLLDFQF